MSNGVYARLLTVWQKMVECGTCAYVPTMVVNDQVFQVLTDKEKDFNGQTIQVGGYVGNGLVTYQLRVFHHPSFPNEAVADGAPYFFVPYTIEDYMERVFGKEMELINRIPVASFATRTVVLVEGNPISGTTIALSYFGKVIEVHYTPFEQLKTHVMHLEQNGGVSLDTLQEFVLQQRRNPPAITWGGELSGEDEHLWFHEESISPFALIGNPRKSHVGRILMQEPLRIVAVMEDGFGKFHTRVIHETQNVWDFIAVALKYFWPEEIFFFLGYKKLSDLELIRRMATLPDRISELKSNAEDGLLYRNDERREIGGVVADTRGSRHRQIFVTAQSEQEYQHALAAYQPVEPPLNPLLTSFLASLVGTS